MCTHIDSATQTSAHTSPRPCAIKAALHTTGSVEWLDTQWAPHAAPHPAGGDINSEQAQLFCKQAQHHNSLQFLHSSQSSPARVPEGTAERAISLKSQKVLNPHSLSSLLLGDTAVAKSWRYFSYYKTQEEMNEKQETEACQRGHRLQH